MKIKDIRALIRDNPATQFARRPSSTQSVNGGQSEGLGANTALRRERPI